MLRKILLPVFISYKDKLHSHLCKFYVVCFTCMQITVILLEGIVATCHTCVNFRGYRGRDHMVVGFTTTYAISAYHHLRCEFESCSWWGVLNTTLCDKICQWHVAGRWYSPGTPVSSTNKTNCHDIAEILLKVALNTITPNPCINFYFRWWGTGTWIYKSDDRITNRSPSWNYAQQDQ